MRVNSAAAGTIADVREAAEAALIAGDSAGARALLLDAVVQSGPTADLLCDLAVVEHAIGNRWGALDLTIDALRLDPDHIDAAHNRSMLIAELQSLGMPAPAPAPAPPAAANGALRVWVPQSASVDSSWYEGVDEPNLDQPVSQMATIGQTRSPHYVRWLEALDHRDYPPNRKIWEWVYICRTLEAYGALESGKRGIGFGVGTEPLTAAFAARGCEILGTDLPAAATEAGGWNKTNQHSASLNDLRKAGICSDAEFDRLVRFQPLDMNDLSPMAAQRGSFDFMWSSCVVEHLGGYRLTDHFIIDSLQLLRPGGIAIHTTEFNIGDVVAPIETPGCTFFTKRWVERLARQINEAGGRLVPLNPSRGSDMLDGVVDFPPFCWKNHMKVVIESGSVLTTSVGLVVIKNP